MKKKPKFIFSQRECTSWYECPDCGCVLDIKGNTPHWIPPTERLPDNNSIVIATVNYGNNIYVENVRYLNGDWEEPNYSEWVYDTEQILAWQPLPEPYQEVHND